MAFFGAGNRENIRDLSGSSDAGGDETTLWDSDEPLPQPRSRPHSRMYEYASAALPSRPRRNRTYPPQAKAVSSPALGPTDHKVWTYQSTRSNRGGVWTGTTPADINLDPSSIRQALAKDLVPEISEKIDQFYGICRRSIEFAISVCNHGDSNESASQSDKSESLGYSHQQSTSHRRCSKRKLGTSESILPSDDKGSPSVTTNKRAKQKDDLLVELPCWWYMRDPERYRMCANNCSRNRSLHSYRRHHFDDHWRWGDVDSANISVEVWNAAKHAKCGQITASSPEKDRLTWIKTYRVLFELSEAVAVPDPVCSTPDHVHIKAKGPLVQPLPVILTKARSKELPTSAEICASAPLAHHVPQNLEASFLDPTMGDLGTSPFSPINLDSLCDPTMDSFETGWANRSQFAKSLLESKHNLDALESIVSDHVSRISALLDSMIKTPGQVSCATIRQVINHAIDFETCYNNAAKASNLPVQSAAAADQLSSSLLSSLPSAGLVSSSASTVPTGTEVNPSETWNAASMAPRFTGQPLQDPLFHLNAGTNSSTFTTSQARREIPRNILFDIEGPVDFRDLSYEEYLNYEDGIAGTSEM